MKNKTERKNWKDMCQEILDSAHGFVRLQHSDITGDEVIYDCLDPIADKCTRPYSHYQDKNATWIEIVICVETDRRGHILDLDFMESFRFGTSWKKIYEALYKYRNHVPEFANDSGLVIDWRSKHWRRITKGKDYSNLEFAKLPFSINHSI